MVSKVGLKIIFERACAFEAIGRGLSVLPQRPEVKISS